MVQAMHEMHAWCRRCGASAWHGMVQAMRAKEEALLRMQKEAHNTAMVMIVQGGR